MIYRKLRIRGRVQGVYYRGWSVETARSLGLSGWVRNRRDGSVEALVAGEVEVVARFVELCRRGPAAARVENIEEVDVAAEPLDGFRQLPTE
ncbi:acylphosphatase [Sphingomonas sp. DBB INV C78]|uniref:acylphosphatase n=1 Tax=Sphingomonas sp. DBB INV C78 TaxID=3349434 RepID=UPI0036D3A8BC